MVRTHDPTAEIIAHKISMERLRSNPYYQAIMEMVGDAGKIVSGALLVSAVVGSGLAVPLAIVFIDSAVGSMAFGTNEVISGGATLYQLKSGEEVQNNNFLLSYVFNGDRVSYQGWDMLFSTSTAVGLASVQINKMYPSMAESGKKADFYVTPEGEAIPQSAYHSLSDFEARKWYLEQEARIPDLIDYSQSLEQQAYQAFFLRNKFRTAARELMSNRELAESLYITNPNLTWEELMQKQVDKGLTGDDIYRSIIESSQR